MSTSTAKRTPLSTRSALAVWTAAAGLLGALAGPALADSGGPTTSTVPSPVAIVDVLSGDAGTAGDWASLTTGAKYGTNIGEFDDDAPSVYVNDGGVAVLTSPTALAAFYAGQKANQIRSLLVLITLGPGADASGVRLTVTEPGGGELTSADPSSVLLDAQNAVDWTTAGFPDPTKIPGFGNQQDPFPRDQGTVLGAIILFDPALNDPSADVDPGTLLATIRYEILDMTMGAVRIDFFGIDDDGVLLFNSPNSGGAYYEASGGGGPAVPEPGLLALAALGALAALARRRRGAWRA